MFKVEIRLLISLSTIKSLLGVSTAEFISQLSCQLFTPSHSLQLEENLLNPTNETDGQG